MARNTKLELTWIGKENRPRLKPRILLEDTHEVLKWFKPAQAQVRVYHSQDSLYVPDFIVETVTARYLCKTKRAMDMQTEDVQSKAKAAALWCQNATQVTDKPWHYLLIPHDAVTANASFRRLLADCQTT